MPAHDSPPHRQRPGATAAGTRHGTDAPGPALPRRTLLGGIGGVLGLGAAVSATGCTPVARQVGRTGGGGGRRGGSLVMAQSTEPNLPTLRQQNTPNISWPRLVFNTLTSYDRASLRPRPQLATGWTVSDDQRTVVLRLRDDVRFHSGRPFGPRDVIENVTYQASAKGSPGQLRPAAATVTDATASGPHEVTLRLAHRISNFFDLCEIMLIFDHESIPELEAGRELNGTGAFTFDGYQPGVAMRFRRNPHYWIPGRPYLDDVELRIITQQQAVVASLQSGQTHLAFGLSPGNARNIRADDRLTLTEIDTRDAGQYIGCNVRRRPLHDKRVRQAIAWAVDRVRVRDMAMFGAAVITSVPWTPGSPAYDAKTAAHYHQDLDRARGLIREAGAHGERIELTIMANDPQPRAIAEIVQDGMRAIGLDTAITPLQPAAFQERLTTATFPGLWVSGHGFGQLTPATLLNGAYPFNAQKNASNFVDAEYRALADRAWRTAGDPDAARRVYDDVTELLLDRQFVIDLVSSSGTYASSDALRGFDYNMFNDLVLDDAHLAGS
jgi:peptide/nickel transport system substrate-binding protein